VGTPSSSPRPKLSWAGAQVHRQVPCLAHACARAAKRAGAGCTATLAWVCLFGLSLVAASPLLAQTGVKATTVVLQRPSAVVAAGNGVFYFAERNRHTVDRVDANGTLTIVAGDGVAGFSGDGSSATSAQLDSPEGVALDASGNLYIADTLNHRVRRVDAATGTITTVAGTGAAGVSGDSGPATAAALRLPSGIAVDAIGTLYIADRGDSRVRRVDATTGTITTIAGDGVQGTLGDGGAATAAELDAPSAVALDAAGHVLIAEKHNGHVRSVDLTTGLITSVATQAAPLSLPLGVSVDGSGAVLAAAAGSQSVQTVSPVATLAGAGVQGFAGDGAQAAAATLDTPSAVAAGPVGTLLTDRGNGRIRLVVADGVILTVAGGGSPTPLVVTLSTPTAPVYGSASVAVSASSGGGALMIEQLGSFPSNQAAQGTKPTVLASGLTLNPPTTTVPLTSLVPGTYQIVAVYDGDAQHLPVLSTPLALTVARASALFDATAAAMLYGQQVPALTGTLTGILPQDAAKVVAVPATVATSTTSPGVYPITAMLTGPAAADYTLSFDPASGSLTISKAPTVVTLALPDAANPTAPQRLVGTAISTTSGTPTGTIRFFDGQNVVGETALNAGVASLPATALPTGANTLTAYYPGDQNFLPSTSAGNTINIGAPTPDFSLTAVSASSTTIQSGSATTFQFDAIPLNGVLTSPITLSVTGLPPLATATFNPASLPPSNTATNFTLTVQTKLSASLRLRQDGVERASNADFASNGPAGSGGRSHQHAWPALALLLLAIPRRRWKSLAACLALLALAGCGNRAVPGSAPVVPVSYLLTVTGTATTSTGAILQHSAIVSLTVQ
jgi:hypothetical protein